jgi:hypothetical protein
MDKRTAVIDTAKAYKDLVVSNFPVKIEQFRLYGSYYAGFLDEIQKTGIEIGDSY